jgi:hypothetical protein
MSYEPGDKSPDPRIHFEAGMKDFTRLDKVRFINIFGSIQYNILYSLIYFIVGIFVHYIFPPFTKNISLLRLAGWILLQCLVLIILSFYVKKFIEAIPGMLSFFPQYFNLTDLQAKGFVPYDVDEYKGDLTTSIVLIGTQYRLFEKIAYLTEQVVKKYF